MLGATLSQLGAGPPRPAWGRRTAMGSRGADARDRRRGAEGSGESSAADGLRGSSERGLNGRITGPIGRLDWRRWRLLVSRRVVGWARLAGPAALRHRRSGCRVLRMSVL